MSDITSHPAYQATRRCLALVPDAVLFEAVTYEMDMGLGYAPSHCPVCLVGTLIRCSDPSGTLNGGGGYAAVRRFGGDWHDWFDVYAGVVRPGNSPAIEAAVVDELLSRV